MNQITSIQELNNLLNERKITQAEYDELLTAMSNRVEPEPSKAAAEMPTQIKFSDLAVASFVLSLMTFVFGPFTGIPAIICGHIARRKIKRNTNLKGSGIAMAGLIIGYPITIFLTLTISFVILAKPTPPEVNAADNRGFDAVEFRHFPIDSMEGVTPQPGLEFDTKVSFDGNGSFKIRRAKGSPREFILLETGPLDIHDTKLVCQARTIGNSVSLDMYCDIPGREKSQCITGGGSGYGSPQSDWNLFETEMLFLEGEKPRNIILKAIIYNSAETVWIDDIRLLRSAEDESSN